MGSQKPFSLVRFSLRTLFVLITAICVFLGYELDWIRKRNRFLREQGKLFAEEARSGTKNLPSIIRANAVMPPHLLWIFDKHGVDTIPFVVKDGVIKQADGTFAIAPTNASFVRAKALFPEAKWLLPYADRRSEGKSLQPIIEIKYEQ